MELGLLGVKLKLGLVAMGVSRALLGFGFRIVAWVGNSRKGGWGLHLIKDKRIWD